MDQLKNENVDLTNYEFYNELRALLEQAGFTQAQSSTKQPLFDLKLISAYPAVGKLVVHVSVDLESYHVRITLLSTDSTFDPKGDLITGLSVYVLLDTDLTAEGLGEIRVVCQVFSAQKTTTTHLQNKRTMPA